MQQEFGALRYQLVEAIESSKLILQRSNNEIGVLCESVRSLDLQQALAATRSQCLMLETQQEALAIKVEGLIKQADQQASPAPVPKPPGPAAAVSKPAPPAQDKLMIDCPDVCWVEVNRVVDGNTIDASMLKINDDAPFVLNAREMISSKLITSPS